MCNMRWTKQTFSVVSGMISSASVFRSRYLEELVLTEELPVRISRLRQTHY